MSLCLPLSNFVGPLFSQSYSNLIQAPTEVKARFCQIQEIEISITHNCSQFHHHFAHSFLYESFLPIFRTYIFVFWHKDIGAKATLIMLVKLTPSHRILTLDFINTQGQFHQPNGVKSKCAGLHSSVPFSFTNKTMPIFAIHSIRIYIQLRCVLYAVCQKDWHKPTSTKAGHGTLMKLTQIR